MYNFLRHHNKSGGDGFLASVAVLPIAGPVVLLTVELSLSFIVPVRQNAATFTAPAGKREAGRGSRNEPATRCRF